MVLSDILLKKLVCPNCKGKLVYEKEKDKLICHKCNLAYRITNNIPVLLNDEAEKL
ncbi:MAG: Trm112 family protein [FCB group bacterium]|nr:Trm112 family protein [FCB group bacterium]